ncbi:Uncharacterised protein r2_g466 [Pycnogonum litorale]
MVFRKLLEVKYFKTKSMCFRGDNQRIYKLNNDELVNVDSIKFLGVHIDKNLNFKEHVNEILSKSNRRFHCINCARKCGVSKEDLLILYRAYVMPIIDYASIVWSGFLNEEEINKIEKFEKRCLGRIHRVKRSES